jgi:hypothetical protein
MSTLQTRSDVEMIYKSSAFKDVIFGYRQQVVKPLGDLAVAGTGFVTVRFIIKCAAAMCLWMFERHRTLWHRVRLCYVLGSEAPSMRLDVFRLIQQYSCVFQGLHFEEW